MIELHIAMVLDEVQRFDEALVALGRGLEISEATRGPASADAVQLHAGFSLVHARLEQHEDGLQHALEAVRILELLKQDEHPDMAMCLGYAGEALVGLGRAAEALKLQGRALSITEKILGEDHPEVATALIQLAHTQTALEDVNGAQQSYERALQIRVDSNMPRHAIGDARRMLAKLLRGRDPGRAKQLARLALADFEASEVNRPDTEAELRALSEL